MQTLYIPKYGITYRVNPKNPRELLWSVKPFGPMTAWQHAYTFNKPIRALDTDDQTGQGVVVLNDSTTYVGSGVRVWGRKFYTAGSRIYSLYAIGESKITNKLKIKIHSISEKKQDANLNTLMSEFKKILGENYNIDVFNETNRYGQQLVIAVQGVGEFFCRYELSYDGTNFNVSTWEAESMFDKDCDLELYHKLEEVFNKYCGE